MTLVDTLVFSGGGPDGVAFIGCVRWLEDQGMLSGGGGGSETAAARPPDHIDHIRTVVGCSAGAIVALMLALRMTSREMEAWLRLGVASGDLTEVAVDGLLLVADRLGVDDGARVLSTLRALLRERFPSLAAEADGDGFDVTFLQLAKATGRDLKVGVACLEDARGMLMSVDTSPDLGVLKAVRMSFSVPLLFTPVVHEGRTYVDGGLFDYCPTQHIESSGAATSTLAVRITVPPVPPRAPGDPPLDFVSYALLLVRAVMMRSSNGRTQRPQAEAAAAAPSPTRVRSVDVPSLLAEGFAGEREGEGRGRMSFDARSMSLVVPAESIDRYLAHGYDAMNIFSRG